MADLLVVDDDADIRDLLVALLGRAGHTVHVASNGREGLEMCVRLHPDLVVMDVKMPVLAGDDAVRLLRTDAAYAQVRDTPVVMLSARARPEDVALGEAIGADGYVTKPFGTRALVELVSDLVRHGRRP